MHILLNIRLGMLVFEFISTDLGGKGFLFKERSSKLWIGVAFLRSKVILVLFLFQRVRSVDHIRQVAEV